MSGLVFCARTLMIQFFAIPTSPPYDQARLNSFAYLSAKEEEEPWISMAVHSSTSKAAESVWGRFTSPKESVISADMSRSAYLRAFVPSEGSSASGALHPGRPALDHSSLVPPSSSSQPLSPTNILALAASLRSLFSKHPVCTMANVRQWLHDPANSTIAKEITVTSERALHEAILSTGLVVSIRRVYLLKATDNTQTDPFRAVLLDLLKDKETFKRAEVVEASALRVSITARLIGSSVT
jgi:hypothetical protein